MINEIKMGLICILHFACCMLHFSFDFAFGSTLNLIEENGSAESEFDSEFVVHWFRRKKKETLFNF